MQVACGCLYDTDARTGAMRRTARCDHHQRAFRPPAGLGEAYYQELSVLDSGGRLADSRHVAEMREALGPFPAAGDNARALEIGCGVSPYVGALRAAGWRYSGLDISPWAAGYNAIYWATVALAEDWEIWHPLGNFGLILAAHSLEHMRDAPAALDKMATYLDHDGWLIVLVPDDRDAANPDHNWLFNEQSLTRAAELAEIEVQKLERRQIVAREDFLYLLGRRP